jgi:HEAT repeat protein
MASDWQGLCQDLQSGMQRKQLQALKSLQNSEVTTEAEATVMAAISSCMTTAQADVRAMAVKTFGNLAEPGDRKCIDVIGERLTDDHWSVRRAAVESLGQVAIKGDPDAIATVGAMIRDSHAEVRTPALEVFALLTQRGDIQQALPALNTCLEDWNPEIRRAAVLALGALARGGRMPLNRRSTTMFVNKQALQQQTPKQAEPKTLMDTVVLMDILPAITAQLNDVHPEVRRTAVEVLGQCSPKGDKEMVAKLRMCLQDRIWQVRKAAVEALSSLEEDDGKKVNASVGAMVKDSHASVRKAAGEALARQSTRMSSRGKEGDAGRCCCCLFREETDGRPWSREGTDCSFRPK